MERYAGWSTSKGGEIRSDLIEVHDFSDGTGRGIRAKQDIEAGQVLVQVPREALVSVENVTASGSGLGSAALRKALRQGKSQGVLEDTDVVAIFLMWARAGSNKDKLDPAFVEYLDILPEVEDGPSPLNQIMFWSEDELKLLVGTDSYHIALQLKVQLREDFAKIVSNFFLEHPDLFPMDDDTNFTYREYKWALGILWSRGMDFQAYQNGNRVQAGFRAMVPFADLFNSDFQGPVSHSFNLAVNAVQVLANRNYKAGDQVFINYTPTSSLRLAQLYGFAIRPPANAAHEAVQLWATMNTADPRFADAQVAIAKVLPGVNPNTTPFPLTEADPLPKPLLIALHCQRGQPAPVDGTPYSAEVLRELLVALQERMNSYYNKGDRMKDLQLAMKGAELSERERIALYVRMSETRILVKTIQALEKELLNLTMPPAATDTATAQADIELQGLDDMD